jgi:hypothetical protein
MSAPNTNVEKQKRRHWPVLWGIGAVVVFAAILFLMNVYSSLDDDADWVDDDAQMIDGSAPTVGN